MSKIIYIPHIVPHCQGVVDIGRVFDLIALHVEVLYTQGMDFTYKISIGREETRVIFSVKTRKIQKN